MKAITAQALINAPYGFRNCQDGFKYFRGKYRTELFLLIIKSIPNEVQKYCSIHHGKDYGHIIIMAPVNSLIWEFLAFTVEELKKRITNTPVVLQFKQMELF